MSISSTLMGLLRYTQTAEPDFTWQALAKVLSPFYSSHMNLQDVVEVMLSLYEEALSEPRFELGHGPTAFRKILLAPVKDSAAITWPAPKNGGTPYSVERYYNAMLDHMGSSLRFARVDWCFPPNAASAAVACAGV